MPSFRAPNPLEPSTTFDSDGAAAGVDGGVAMIGGSAGGTAGVTAIVGTIGCPGAPSVGPSDGTLTVVGAGTRIEGRGLAVAVPVEELVQAALTPASATATAAAMAIRTTRTADTSEPSSTRNPPWHRRQQDRNDGR